MQIRVAPERVCEARIVERRSPECFELEYFEGVASFRLAATVDGGTDLLLIHAGVGREHWNEVHAGWLNVLFPLEAMLGYGVDLRNRDPGRSWDQRYADQWAACEGGRRALYGAPRIKNDDRQGGAMESSAKTTAFAVRLHRVLIAPPERVYRAFLDADAMAKWLPPHGFTGKVHEADARVGGTYRMSFTNFSTGHSHSFGGRYVELVPHERIRYTDTFDDPSLPGEMQTTVTLETVSCGTEVHVVQDGIPGVIPPEACYLGWQESLSLLALLVEAEIRE